MISLKETYSSKVKNPQSSSEISLFNEGGKLKIKNFRGEVKELAPSIINNITESKLDFFGLIEKALNDKIAAVVEILNGKASIEELKTAFGALAQSLADTNAILNENNASLDEVFSGLDETLAGISGKLEALDAKIEAGDRENSDNLSSFVGESLSYLTRIEESLRGKASREELEAVKNSIPTVSSGSENVKINRSGNDYKISVDVPEITREVIREVSPKMMAGGGVTKSWVQAYVAENAGTGTGGGIGEAPIDGFQYTRKDGAWTVLSISGASSTTWGSISGTLSNQTDLNNALNARTLKTETSYITGSLQTQINNKVSADILRTEVAGISSNLQTQINNKVSADILRVEVASISSGLQTQINNKVSADILRTEVASISAGLNAEIIQASTRSIVFVIDGGDSVPTTKEYSSIVAPFSGTITNWSIVADVSGSCVLDVWKANGSKPTNSNTIVASAKPTLTTQNYATSSTLTGWTTSVVSGDVLTIELESISNAKRITLQLGVTV